MDINFSRDPANTNRFKIDDIKETGDKTGVAGFHGGVFSKIIGWISCHILHKTVPVKSKDKGTYYLNCKSLKNFQKRVGAEAINDVHNQINVELWLQQVKKRSTEILVVTRDDTKPKPTVQETKPKISTSEPSVLPKKDDLIQEIESYAFCRNFDIELATIDADLVSGKANFQSVQTRLEEIKQKLKPIIKETREKELLTLASRILVDLTKIQDFVKALSSSQQIQPTNPKPIIVKNVVKPSLTNQEESIAPISTYSKQPPLVEFLDPSHIIQPGKEITKIEPFYPWLDKEYTNKDSPTYKAYLAIGELEKLDKALFIGVRGDGDCGFRAMIVSLIFELAASPQCEEKFKQLLSNLFLTIEENQDACPGFENLNPTCLKNLKDCNGNPEKLLNLLNNETFIKDFTRILRFLSNAYCIKQWDQLPEILQNQLTFNEGAEKLGSPEAFLRESAYIDVNKEIPAYAFAGHGQIDILSHILGLGYSINKVNEGNSIPEEPQLSIPNNAILVLNLLCRDTRHFDVIFKKP